MLTIVPTVDTEALHGSSPFDQFILGRIAGRGDEWGVFRILDICRRNGAGVTFFVDVYESVFWGEDRFRDLVLRLVDGGGDVQLHTHPEFRGPPSGRRKPPVCALLLGNAHLRGPMTGLSQKHQTAFLRAGMDMLKSWTGITPVAHRSGGYSIDGDTVQALRAVGIPLDSSMHKDHPYSHINWSTNAVVERDRLLEFPVTVQDYTLGFPGAGSLSRWRMKTDINSCSLAELVAFVDYAVANGLTLMNLFVHSYSLIEFDAHYVPVAARTGDARKLDKFLAMMRERDDVRVLSCAEALAQYRRAPEEFSGPDLVPERNALALIARHGVAKLRRRARSVGGSWRRPRAKTAA